MANRRLFFVAAVIGIGILGPALEPARGSRLPEAIPANRKSSKPAIQDTHVPANHGSAEAGKTEAIAPLLPTDYRIGAEDELTIAVWHEPEFSQAVVVRPDGMITLPLINEVKVVGLTTGEMQVLLTEKLKNLVNDPQVTVIVKAVKSRKVFLMGNVVKQGVYPLGGKKTVLEVIAEAGGLGPFAKSKSIYVLRKENGREVKIPFNYKKALSGKGTNPDLMPGDIVVVP